MGGQHPAWCQECALPRMIKLSLHRDYNIRVVRVHGRPTESFHAGWLLHRACCTRVVTISCCLAAQLICWPSLLPAALPALRCALPCSAPPRT